MPVESKPHTETPIDLGIIPPGFEEKSGFLKSEVKKIQDWTQDYLARLPQFLLLHPRDSEYFYKKTKNADERLENKFRKHLEKISRDKKLTVDKAAFIRWVCAVSIWELNRRLAGIHLNSHGFVGQLTRRLVLFTAEVSNHHTQDLQGHKMVIGREWLGELTMDLCGLEYTYRLPDLRTKLRQFVQNPSLEPAEEQF